MGRHMPLKSNAVFLVLSALLFICACESSRDSHAQTTTTTAGVAPTTLAAASVQRVLEVPASLVAPPFDTAKTLTVPPGFGIRLWARVPTARFMALAPNGDVLVSVPAQGKIVLLRKTANGTVQNFDFASGLTKPHDMVFHTIGSTTYLYVAESGRITRSVYAAGETSRGTAETVIDKLPDSSTAELRGNYGHELKNIALGPDDRLYVSIASTCNACEADTVSNPVRGAIYQYTADGKNGRLFARGLRNAEGLDFIPGTNTLWVAVNNRDEIAYPYHNDFNGDGQNDFGTILPKYVDTNPPELFTQVRDGGNYGWPFCNQIPNATMTSMELVQDAQLNSDGAKLSCATVDRSSKGIRAHSAPLGLSFLQSSTVPAAYRNGAVIALHGCWNCTIHDAGYKVVYFPFDGAGNAGAEMDLVTGFVTDAVKGAYWGRPVDAIADASGNILISDDQAGAVYQLYPLSP